LAISFAASAQDGEVLNKVQSVFVVDIPQLPDQIDASTYSLLFPLHFSSAMLISFLSFFFLKVQS